MYLGLFEPAETKQVADLLTPGDVLIDIGAHIGWYSTLASRVVGPSGCVVACEPYPANTKALRENLALNEATNVRVVTEAIGSEPGLIRLATAGDSGGATALDWASRGPVNAPMTTLDAVAAEIERVDLVKVDVEGWEAHVLRGAVKTLARTRNLLIEINHPALERAGSSQAEVFDLLRESGFTKFVAVPRTGLRRLFRGDPIMNYLVTRADTTS